ncbi:hypothetical protein D3C71_1839110 [compost metagenome]
MRVLVNGEADEAADAPDATIHARIQDTVMVAVNGVANLALVMAARVRVRAVALHRAVKLVNRVNPESLVERPAKREAKEARALT